MTWEPWPDNMPLNEQVKALGAVLMEHYADTFDRSEGAMEKAARLLWEARLVAEAEKCALCGNVHDPDADCPVRGAQSDGDRYE